MNKSTKSTIVLAVTLLFSAPASFGMAQAARTAARYAYWGLTLAPLANNLRQFANLRHQDGSQKVSTKLDFDKKNAALYGAVPTVSHFTSRGMLSTIFRKTAPVMVSPMWRLPFGLMNAAATSWTYKKLQWKHLFDTGNNPENRLIDPQETFRRVRDFNYLGTFEKYKARILGK